jgi:HAD superfamily hydrolase (TIGR01549 family)
VTRWVILDVGETLVDETRVWSTWADTLGVTRLTFMSALGAAIARGGEHRDAFEIVGAHEWKDRWRALDGIYGAIRTDDLYPDALSAPRRLRDAGYRTAILANQPARRTAELRALGFSPDVIAMSDEMGVAKPSPAFFARALELLGAPPAREVAYVGDRVDNDVLPAMAAGMRAIWIRRGPWGVIHQLPEGVRPALVVDSLDELVERIEEAWA